MTGNWARINFRVSADCDVEALRRFPVINASVDGTDILYHESYDIGMAVSTDRGLVVPVLRDADVMSFADIEKAVQPTPEQRALLDDMKDAAAKAAQGSAIRTAT